MRRMSPSGCGCRRQQAQLLAVPDDRLAVERRDPDARRIRRLAHQRGVQLELPRQVGLAHALSRRREQHQPEQVDRRDAGSRIDARHDLLREVVAQRRQPRGLLLGDRQRPAPSAGRASPATASSGKRFAETHVDLAEAAAQFRQACAACRRSIPFPWAAPTVRRCRCDLRRAARSRSRPARTRPVVPGCARNRARSSRACRSSVAAGGRCGCGRPR